MSTFKNRRYRSYLVRFSPHKRDILIAHLDGAPVPIPVQRKVIPLWMLGRRDPVSHRRTLARASWAWRATQALIDGGLIMPLRSDPKCTVITELGRGVLAELLADYAEALVTAGYRELPQVPIPTPVLEAAE